MTAWDFDAAAASSGQEGLAIMAAMKAENIPLDLVILDYQMPNMSGLEATRAIRELEEKSGTHVPIIAVTANAMSGDRDRCIGAGMDEYVTKPLRPKALFTTIEAVLQG